MKFTNITHELVHHAPFTAAGALLGVLFMMLASSFLPHETSQTIFYIFHPAHVALSAYATASMYQFHICKTGEHHCSPVMLIIVGYLGSVGIATLSDSVIPYFGETLLKLPHAEIHAGFIEKWWLVNPLALGGILFAYLFPATKFPHASHVFLSTAASLFHMMMAQGGEFSLVILSGMFGFLFLAVWLPCCMSDIIFPLLFVPKAKNTIVTS